MTDRRFLDALDRTEKTAGIFLHRAFLDRDEADNAFRILNDDDKMPWDRNPVLFGEELTQHAYHYKRQGNPQKHHGLDLIDALCSRIEQHFDGNVVDVFCNRFHDPQHQIEWHRDTYGTHILVLTLGSERNIQFRRRWIRRPFGDRPVETVRPTAGDIYFMPLRLNKTHKHRVCAANDNDAGPRISLVFFFDTPEYATEYRITAWDKLVGCIESAME